MNPKLTPKQYVDQTFQIHWGDYKIPKKQLPAFKKLLMKNYEYCEMLESYNKLIKNLHDSLDTLDEAPNKTFLGFRTSLETMLQTASRKYDDILNKNGNILDKVDMMSDKWEKVLG